MSKRLLILAIIMWFTLFLTACSITSSGSSLDGQMLIWHSWQGIERDVLEKMLNDFKELNPEVGLVVDFYPLDEIKDAYTTQVKAGLGPDILIAPADWVTSLNQAGAIQDISRYEVDLDRYLSAATKTLRDQERIYGLPLSLSTSVLYYNEQLLQAQATSRGQTGSPAELTELIQKASITDTQTTLVLQDLLSAVRQQASQAETERLLPPTELHEILEQADAGHLVVMPGDFWGAQWGVQVFGGRLFDEEGHIVLNQGGLANWLGWLKKAQRHSNIILSHNQSELRSLFMTGQATYYIGNTSELVMLEEALGEKVVGATRLPGQRNKQAGPFLSVEAIMFNRKSTDLSTELALQLAEFLTNPEQQRELVLWSGKLPANKLVNIDLRLNPIVAEFMAQSKTAVPVSLEQFDQVQDLILQGDELYGQVLVGEVSVGQAATILTTELNAQYGMDTVIANRLENCNAAGDITLWTTWTDASRDTLLEIKRRFMNTCTKASLTIVDVNPIELYDRYINVFGTEEVPDLLLANSQLMRKLAVEGYLFNLTSAFSHDFLQQFLPTVEQAVLAYGEVVGIPVTLNSMALYVNTEAVSDSPVSFDDLLISATSDTPVAIPIGFQESYWGISAFNERSTSHLLDDKGRFTLGQFGFPEWLAWLADARYQPGIMLSTNQIELQTSFQAGHAAMLVSDASQLSSLASAEHIVVRPLPSGRPLLDVESLLFHPFTSDKKRDVALKFAQFMSNVESQTLLMKEAMRIPTNINVNLADYPTIMAFVEQADQATVIPNISQVEAVLKSGDSVYEQVLNNDIEPAQAVKEFTDIVDSSNGFKIETD